MFNRRYENFRCSRCNSNEFVQVSAPLPHHAKLVCARCGAFQRWLPSPQTILKQTLLRETISRLLSAPLTERERAFILSISSQQGKLTLKQKSWLDAIAKKYLKGA